MVEMVTNVIHAKRGRLNASRYNRKYSYKRKLGARPQEALDFAGYPRVREPDLVGIVSILSLAQTHRIIHPSFKINLLSSIFLRLSTCCLFLPEY